MTDRICVSCGEATVQRVTLPYDVVHQTQVRVIQDDCMRCDSCGTISYVGDQISKHELAVAAIIRDIDGLLSAEQLLHIRLKYKLRQSDMEAMLSVGPKTWTRWERGKVPQSKSTDKLIRAISEDPVLAESLMKQAEIVNEEASAVFRGIADNAKNLAELYLKSVLKTRYQFDDIALIVESAFHTVDNSRREAAAELEAQAA